MPDIRFLTFSVVVTALLISGGCQRKVPDASPHIAAKVAAKPHYVGSANCTSCHQTEADLFAGSQHDRAMQHANDKTVLGNFDNATFDYAGVKSTFFRRNGKYFVNTDGADGKLADFEIKYTFGVYPLQQYLIQFDDGRVQALGIVWDSRPASAGGRRWFHLYGDLLGDDSVRHGDVLHWTGPNQNWNYMCADCHSTNVHKNYEAATGHFDTSWSEIDVGCEACHGPGSAHLQWAADHSAADGSKQGFAASMSDAAEQIDSCAHCHSRRGIIAENFKAGDAYLDHYLPALLDESMYYADGQIEDEVYVYGSFLQSKMYRNGVRCSDCHEPHSATLKRIGNATCTMCHQPQPDKRFPALHAKSYNSIEHHFHTPGTPGAQCVNCHMSTTTYMQIDARRDHSFRIPRPDLTTSLGIPNACNKCHADKTPAWAADVIVRKFGPPPDTSIAENFAPIIAAGRRGMSTAEANLATLAADGTTAPIVRATALSLLGNYRGAQSADTIRQSLNSPDPLIRIGALRAARGIAIATRWNWAEHLLSDSLLSVRNEAAALLAPAKLAVLDGRQHRALDDALHGYITSQQLNAERPEAQVNLGSLYVQLGRNDDAEKAYDESLRLQPKWVPAMINLADLYRSTGRDSLAGELLTRALSLVPDNADVNYAYGLWLIRAGKSNDALKSLQISFEQSPDNVRYAYVYAIALNSAGQTDDALQVLLAAQEKSPNDTDILYALATMYRDQGNFKQARDYAKQLLDLMPNNKQLQQFAIDMQNKAVVSKH